MLPLYAPLNTHSQLQLYAGRGETENKIALLVNTQKSKSSHNNVLAAGKLWTRGFDQSLYTPSSKITKVKALLKLTLSSKNSRRLASGTVEDVDIFVQVQLINTTSYSKPNYDIISLQIQQF